MACSALFGGTPRPHCKFHATCNCSRNCSRAHATVCMTCTTESRPMLDCLKVGGCPVDPQCRYSDGTKIQSVTKPLLPMNSAKCPQQHMPAADHSPPLLFPLLLSFSLSSTPFSLSSPFCQVSGFCHIQCLTVTGPLVH
jgi:hypothetical protein